MDALATEGAPFRSALLIYPKTSEQSDDEKTHCALYRPHAVSPQKFPSKPRVVLNRETVDNFFFAIDAKLDLPRKTKGTTHIENLDLISHLHSAKINEHNVRKSIVLKGHFLGHTFRPFASSSCNWSWVIEYHVLMSRILDTPIHLYLMATTSHGWPPTGRA